MPLPKADVRLTPEQLARFRGATVPDILPPGVRLLFVGINPSLWTAAVQAHFARRGNRFYPALHQAGILDRVIDASGGYRPDDLHHVCTRGIGITNLAAPATARADELDSAQLVAGAEVLRGKIATHQPGLVAILGITAYRVAFGQRSATIGPQEATLEGSPLWVLPNPSGLNAHVTTADLAAVYRQAAVAAGLPVYPAR